METIGVIVNAVLAGCISLIFYLLKRSNDRLDNVMTEPQVRQLIDDKLEPLIVKHNNIQNDINRLEQKIDYLIDLFVSK